MNRVLSGWNSEHKSHSFKQTTLDIYVFLYKHEHPTTDTKHVRNSRITFVNKINWLPYSSTNVIYFTPLLTDWKSDQIEAQRAQRL